METVAPCSFSKSIDGFQFIFALSDGEISIKAESQVDSALYSCKLSNDTLPGSARVIFEDINGFYEGYAAILKDSSQMNSITFDKRGVLSSTHQTLISLARTKVLKVNIQLEREAIELETELRISLAKANKRICQLETYVKKLIKKPIHDETYKEIHPQFNPECIKKIYLAFSNANRTATGKPGYTISAPAKEALPIQGKFRFSVRIDRAKDSEIFIGIMHESQKTAQNCYSAQGSYSICLSNNYIYRDGTSFQGDMALVARESDTVSILIDMDEEFVSFYIGNELINRIRCKFNAFKNRDFYPFVHFYGGGQSVSFI